MNQPLVSIIIPTYNRAHLIWETLDSLLVQTYTSWECIVVDDGSNDNTGEVLKKYCDKDIRFQYHQRPSNRPKGANACRNYGFELSKGEYVNWFDDDDVMLEDFLKVKVAAFTTNLNFVIVPGYYVNEELQDPKEIILNDEGNLYKEYCLWNLHIITNSVMFKKDFLHANNLYLNKITRGQELEFFSRLFFKIQKKSYKIINIPLFLYRQHSDTKSRKDINYVKSFKESHSYIFIENLKRGVLINDLDIINYYYRLLIEFFFRGLDNNHFDNSKYVLNQLILVLHITNKKLSLELFVFGNILLLRNKGSYRIEKRLKKYKLM